METVPNREKPSLAGNGALLVSAPRNRATGIRLGRGKCDWAGARNTECGPEVGPPSNVTIRFKPSLIREGPPLPPVVRRCLAGVVAIAWLAPLVGNEVFQTQRTGRVAQVGAARPISAKRASALQGSGGLVSALGWHRVRNERRKSGRGASPTSRATAARG